MKGSIYEYIKSNLDEDGLLPERFSLPDEGDSNKLKFAAGAMDGILIYHASRDAMDEKAHEFIEILDAFCEKRGESEKTKIIAFLKEYGVLGIIDPLLVGIFNGKSNSKPNEVFEVAYNFMIESGDVELVKLGIVLMGLFDIGDYENCLEVVLTLGKYDEFSLYSIVCVSSTKDGNELIFKLAKELRAWGKIHAVERLEPTREEIKDWIIKYGCSNAVHNSYLGLVCAEKGNMIDYLRKSELDDETFAGISTIIDALLDEGPVAGIGIYEYADEALGLFLNHVKMSSISLKTLVVVLNIKDWAEDNEEFDIVDLCEGIILDGKWEPIVKKVIESEDENEFYSAWEIAKKLNFNINEQLYNVVNKYPIEYGYCISSLYSSKDYAQKVTDLYEKALPLSSIATGMGDLIGIGPDFKNQGCLDYVLQELGEYPQMGIELVKTGLNSPVVRNRNGSCAVLEKWIEKTEKPLDEISKELYELVNDIKKIEVNEELKDRLSKL